MPAAAALSLLAVACGSSEPSSAPPPTHAGKVEIPAGVQRDIHSRLHELPRICGRRLRRTAVARTARAFLRYQRRYPADRYWLRVDDETGTTFSALLVVRDRLRRCSPRWTEAIDATLPARVRRALRPPVTR